MVNTHIWSSRYQNLSVAECFILNTVIFHGRVLRFPNAFDLEYILYQFEYLPLGIFAGR